MLLFDFHDFDFPKLHGVAFGLEADEASGKHLIACDFGEFLGVGIAAELGFRV